MGWLVIDIFLMYLVKSAIRVFRFFHTSNWERIGATLIDWTVIDEGWGCPSVKLQYEFLSDERLIKSSDEIPFQLRWHAKTYTESLSRGLHPIIRVNPNNAQQTCFFERDQ